MPIEQAILDRPWGLSKESDFEKMRELFKLEPTEILMGVVRTAGADPSTRSAQLFRPSD